MKKIRFFFFLLYTWFILVGSVFAVAPQNGWWWNPSESGSGYAIERQGNSIFMTAFLYETSGAPTWYATFLTLQSDGTYKGDMTRYVGGKPLQGAYKAPTSSTTVATATATFLYKDSGTLTISFLNGAPARIISIYRFGFSNPVFEPSQGVFQNGWWWNDQESGTGHFIETQGDQTFVASFMYDTSGQPTWYLSLPKITGSNFLSGPLEMYSDGQSLGGTYKVPVFKQADADSMSYGFSSDSIGTMTLPNNERVPIKRFIFDPKVVSNRLPIPNAGPAQTVNIGDMVYLNGSGTDMDNDALTFEWVWLTAPTGTKTSLYGFKTLTPSFVADLAGIYRLGLIADDGKVSNSSAVITVIALAQAVTNTPPISNAGINQTVNVGNTVVLNGAASSDVNGDKLTYLWSFISKPSGSAASISGTNSVNSNFIPDFVGNYIIGLIVNDGKTSSLQSSVVINVLAKPLNSAEGYWSGSISNGLVASVVVLENNETWGFTTSNNFIYSVLNGTSSGIGNVFSASGKEYNLYRWSISQGSLKGTVVPKSTIKATSSNGPTIDMVYNKNYDLPATQKAVSGNYIITGISASGSSSNVPMEISNTGVLSARSLNCNATGLVVPRSSGKNIYNITVKFTGNGCALGNGGTASGIFILDGSVATAFALTPNKLDGFFGIGKKIF